MIEWIKFLNFRAYFQSISFLLIISVCVCMCIVMVLVFIRSAYMNVKLAYVICYQVLLFFFIIFIIYSLLLFIRNKNPIMCLWICVYHVCMQVCVCLAIFDFYSLVLIFFIFFVSLFTLLFFTLFISIVYMIFYTCVEYIQFQYKR